MENTSNFNEEKPLFKDTADIGAGVEACTAEQEAIADNLCFNTPDGRFSLNDKLGEITCTLRGKLWFLGFSLKVKRMLKKSNNARYADFSISSAFMQMMGGFTVLRLTSMIGSMNVSFTSEELLEMNKKLNRIRKPKNKKK